jgi:hypothetical protein
MIINSDSSKGEFMKKKLLIAGGIIVVFVLYFIINDQTRYTSFADEFDEMKSYYGNESENWEIAEIELSYFDRTNNMGFNTTINDSTTIETISDQLMATELKKSSPLNQDLEDNNFTLILSYLEKLQTTTVHVFNNRVYISEPSLHMTYKEVGSDKLYKLLNELELTWDREFQLTSE